MLVLRDQDFLSLLRDVSQSHGQNTHTNKTKTQQPARGTHAGREPSGLDPALRSAGCGADPSPAPRNARSWFLWAQRGESGPQFLLTFCGGGMNVLAVDSLRSRFEGGVNEH